MKNLSVRYLHENEFDKWDDFVENSPQGSIFFKSYWLKVVSNDFRILICEENDKLVGGIPLPSLYGKFYKDPKLTPQLGILLSSTNKKAKYSTNISKEIEIITALVDRLPDFKQFNYNFNYNFTNFLPFIWKDFDVTAKYTYVLEDLSNLDQVYNNFQYDIKYSIKRAEKNNISVSSEYSIKDFYEINKKTFDRQKIEIPYTLEFLEELDKVLNEHNNRKIFFAVDSDKRVIAAAYILYDDRCSYYLMGGADPEYRNTGAQTLLLWESIKFSATVSKKFDFEGSMVKNIERVFREFGGTQKVIFNVKKSDFITETVYRILRKNKNLIRKIMKV